MKATIVGDEERPRQARLEVVIDGLKWNQAIETGGVLVANTVRIEAEVQFVKQE
ncbi:MAG TPA: hypothetical protein VKZ41_04700 [Gemmatimonadales bacterium]|nr:hypothetical protein [Gemmatimonadales bacterium]